MQNAKCKMQNYFALMTSNASNTPCMLRPATEAESRPRGGEVVQDRRSDVKSRY